MNTITILNGDNMSITYTDTEVTRMVNELKKKAESADELNELLTKQSNTIRSIKENVRDFFSEGQWDDSEFSSNKSDINELLELIGSYKLTTQYGGSFTITGTFQVEAEDEDDAESKFSEGVNVDFYDGDITVDQVESNDIAEDY